MPSLLPINVRQNTCLHIKSSLEHYDFPCTDHIPRLRQNSENFKSPKTKIYLKEIGPEYVYWN